MKAYKVYYNDGSGSAPLVYCTTNEYVARAKFNQYKWEVKALLNKIAAIETELDNKYGHGHEWRSRRRYDGVGITYRWYSLTDVIQALLAGELTSYVYYQGSSLFDSRKATDTKEVYEVGYDEDYHWCPFIEVSIEELDIVIE